MGIIDVSGSSDDSGMDFDANQKGNSILLQRKIAALYPNVKTRIEFCNKMFYIVVGEKVAVLRKSPGTTYVFKNYSEEGTFQEGRLHSKSTAKSDKQVFSFVEQYLSGSAEPESPLFDGPDKSVESSEPVHGEPVHGEPVQEASEPAKAEAIPAMENSSILEGVNEELRKLLASKITDVDLKHLQETKRLVEVLKAFEIVVTYKP